MPSIFKSTRGRLALSIDRYIATPIKQSDAQGATGRHRDGELLVPLPISAGQQAAQGDVSINRYPHRLKEPGQLVVEPADRFVDTAVMRLSDTPPYRFEVKSLAR
jgi:hypothetical protein